VAGDRDRVAGGGVLQWEGRATGVAIEAEPDLIAGGPFVFAGDAAEDLVGGDRCQGAGVAAIAEDHPEVLAGGGARHAVGGGEHRVGGDERGAAIGEGELGGEALAFAERAPEAFGEGGGGEGDAVAIDGEAVGRNQGGQRLSERGVGGGVERIAIVGAVEHPVAALPSLWGEGATSEGESEQVPHRCVVARADGDVTVARATAVNR